MKILLVTQYFWPESFIINDLVSVLVSQGHKVDVLTGKPNYPEGKIFPGYTSSGISTELYDDKVEVYRVPLKARNNGRAMDLILNYISYVFSGLLYFPRFIKKKKYDVVFVFAPSPITQAIPAIYLKWKLKAHLAIWVQDMWPESLSATGFIKNRLLLKAVGNMVRFIYSCSDTLLVQSKAFYAPVSKYADSEKIQYYPNSILLKKENIDCGIPAELKDTLENNFCVVFAGNIGKAQSIQTIVDAANMLRGFDEIKFVFIGSGSMSNWLSSKKEELGLSNIVIAGRFPMEAMPTIYKHSAVLLATLKDEEIFSKTIPSKVQAYMAASKPIIAALNGEGARVVDEAGAGISCNAGDSGAIADAVQKLYGMTDTERLNMGQSGYTYFLENFEMSDQAKKLINLLESRIKEVRGRRK